MEDMEKIVFEEYGIEFTEEDFENLSEEELKECKRIMKEIKKKIEG